LANRVFIFEHLLVKSLTENAAGLIQDFRMLSDTNDMVNAGLKKYLTYMLAMARHYNHETWLALGSLQHLSQILR